MLKSDYINFYKEDLYECFVANIEDIIEREKKLKSEKIRGLIRLKCH